MLDWASSFLVSKPSGGGIIDICTVSTTTQVLVEEAFVEEDRALRGDQNMAHLKPL